MAAFVERIWWIGVCGSVVEVDARVETSDILNE